MSQKRVYTFGNGKAEGNAQMREALGGKGANLAEMNLIGVPVPPGFTITTDCCNEYYEVGQEKIVGLLQGEVMAAVNHIENLMNSKFGDLENPLLVSVRSGARASMPGMMDTILNLGLNDEVAEGMVKKTNNPHFVYDSYRRFVQMYGDVVLEMKPENKEDIDPFEEIIEKVKAERGIKLDKDLTVDELKKLVRLFKEAIKERTGKDFPNDPIEQLWGAICAVFRSWMNERAILYRKMEGIPDEWGTAVSVMAMVFGNMGEPPACASAAMQVTEKTSSTANILSMHKARTSWQVPAPPSRSPNWARSAGQSAQAFQRKSVRRNIRQWKRPCQKSMQNWMPFRKNLKTTTMTCRTWNSPCKKANSGSCKRVMASAPVRLW